MSRPLNPPPKRAESIRVRMTPETLERLKRVSGWFGLPIATIAAQAIGAYITQQERSFAMVDKVADTVGGQVGAAFKHELAVLQGKSGQLKLWHGPGKRRAKKKRSR